MTATLRWAPDRLQTAIDDSLERYRTLRAMPASTDAERAALFAAFQSWDERNQRLLDNAFVPVPWHATSPKSDYATLQGLEWINLTELPSEKASELLADLDERARRLGERSSANDRHRAFRRLVVLRQSLDELHLSCQSVTASQPHVVFGTARIVDEVDEFDVDLGYLFPHQTHDQVESRPSAVGDVADEYRLPRAESLNGGWPVPAPLRVRVASDRIGLVVIEDQYVWLLDMEASLKERGLSRAGQSNEDIQSPNLVTHVWQASLRRAAGVTDELNRQLCRYPIPYSRRMDPRFWPVSPRAGHCLRVAAAAA